MPKHSPLASVSATRSVLEEHGLSTKKSLGQHFLVNDAVVGRICRLANVQPGDAVLEVGPGIGTLTCALLACGAEVVAVERDEALLPVIAQTCAQWGEQLSVVPKDALKLQEADLPAPSRKFVANLPYAVAATLVLDYFERFEALQSATVMVQAEVAARMAASPGTKDFGAYTVKLALLAHTGDMFKVSPGSFFPPPHVDSAVIRLDRIEKNPLSAAQRKAAARMADAAFANRRKTLGNSCKAYFARQPEVARQLPDLFESCGIDPSRRGETLCVAEFAELGRRLCALGG